MVGNWTNWTLVTELGGNSRWDIKPRSRVLVPSSAGHVKEPDGIWPSVLHLNKQTKQNFRCHERSHGAIKRECYHVWDTFPMGLQTKIAKGVIFQWERGHNLTLKCDRCHVSTLKCYCHSSTLEFNRGSVFNGDTYSVLHRQSGSKKHSGPGLNPRRNRWCPTRIFRTYSLSVETWNWSSVFYTDHVKELYGSKKS